MKKLIIPILISAFLFSCESEESKNPIENADSKATVEEKKEVTIDLKNLREFDMTEYDLEATIYVPEKHYMISEEEEGLEAPVVKHSEGEAYWELSMRSDKNWNITIEDWDDEEKTIALEKEIHKETTDVYAYNYIDEGEDYLMYQRSLSLGSTTMDEKTASKLPNYHFVVIKKINGVYITIKSNDLGDYRKLSVQKMLNAARAIK